MSRDAIGLDIGGANLKAATASGQARTIPFELWRRPDRLADELVRIRDEWSDIGFVGVTMTGELCDCFQTKRDGVRHILAAVEAAFPGRAIRVWSTTGRFVDVDAANQNYMAVASANWHALATFVGRDMPDGSGLLLDTGSTTTDIIPLRNGMPTTASATDEARLRSGEQVYTGVRRTPVCAVLGPEVTAEWFATTHDVYVRLGMLPEEPDNRSTADGRPMTDSHAHARLSRMLGGDPEITKPNQTMGLARRVFDAQRRIIADAIRAVLGRLPDAPGQVCLAGSGEFLARATWDDVKGSGLANRIPMCSMASRQGPTLSEAACAYAVAVLAVEASMWD
jgi:probable H4MPT-linked C1 transfer pathway protein